MRYPHLFRSCIVSLFISGCHHIEVRDHSLANYPFAAPHRWIASDRSSASDEMNLLIHARVSAELASRGYTEVHQRDQADWEMDWAMSESIRHRHSVAGGGWGSAGPDKPGQHAVAAPRHDPNHALPPSVDPYSPDYEVADFHMVLKSLPEQTVLWEVAAEDEGDFGYHHRAQLDAISELVPKLLKTLP